MDVLDDPERRDDRHVLAASTVEDDRVVCVFFFQAGDGIRDLTVTGVQTCALPISRATPDYFALQVLNTILGGAFTSRLNQNLRETHGYTYGAFSQFSAGRLAGPFVASASVGTAKTDSSLIEFPKELRRIRDEPVPDPELAKAKAYITLGLPADFGTTGGAAGRVREAVGYRLALDYFAH